MKQNKGKNCLCFYYFKCGFNPQSDFIRLFWGFLFTKKQRRESLKVFYDLLEKLEENIISMFEKKQRKEDFIGNLFTILKKIKMKTTVIKPQK